MYLSEYIRKEISPLGLQDTVEKAQALINVFQLNHLPIVEKKMLLGMLPEEAIIDANPKDTLEKYKDSLQKFALTENNILLDTYNIFYTQDTNIIPIIDEKDRYKGIILSDDVIANFSRFPFISENGAVIIVENTLQNYSMAEIGRIVESNNARIFGAIITKMDMEIIQITLKISSENLSSVGETFERFGYTVMQKFYIDKKDELMQDRMKQLQKYLNI